MCLGREGRRQTPRPDDCKHTVGVGGMPHNRRYRVIGLDAAAAEPGTIWHRGSSGPASRDAAAASGREPLLLRVDLSSEAEVAALPARLRCEAVTAVDCLVNNAAVRWHYDAGGRGEGFLVCLSVAHTRAQRAPPSPG